MLAKIFLRSVAFIVLSVGLSGCGLDLDEACEVRCDRASSCGTLEGTKAECEDECRQIVANAGRRQKCEQELIELAECEEDASCGDLSDGSECLVEFGRFNTFCIDPL